MATNISIYGLCSDGTFVALRDTVTEDTLTEIKTDASADLNITGDVGLGQAFQDKTLVRAVAKVQTDDATTGCLSWADLKDAQGTIICPIQGGGSSVSALPVLVKPVRLKTGIIAEARWQAVADSVQYGALMCYTASGMCDVFYALGVDSTPTSMQNASGATVGQSLAGQVIVGAYATYSATNGLDDNDDGVNAFYIESAEGQLKAMYPPGRVGNGTNDLTNWIRYPVRIDQNDTLTITASLA